MLLRASSQAIGAEAKLEAAIGEGDSGLPHGELLTHFAEVATRGSEELASVRDALLAAVGGAGLVEAAATTGIFNGLVRVADATGVPVDEGTLSRSQNFREALSLNDFAGATNSDLSVSAGEGESDSVFELFTRR